MALENIENGTLADAEVVNGNFEYLDDRITDTVSKIYANNSNFESRLTNLQSYLEESISTNIAAVNSRIDDADAGLEAADAKIDEIINCPRPELVPLVDWDNMAFKANVTDVRNINNATTGIKAYGGDYPLLRSGDIYLTEDFTNYGRILCLFCDDTGQTMYAKIWESWELDFILGLNTGDVNIIGGGGYRYWDVYGYAKELVYGGVTYKTTKKYFNVVGRQNAALIEIYGLKYEENGG